MAVHSVGSAERDCTGIEQSDERGPRDPDHASRFLRTELIDLAYSHLRNSSLKRLSDILAERHLAAVGTDQARANIDHCQQLVELQCRSHIVNVPQFEQFAHSGRIYV